MYERILVPLDGSELSDGGLNEAMKLAKDSNARLVLLHVIDDYPTMREFASSKPLQDMRRQRLHQGYALLAPRLRVARDWNVQVQDFACFATETASASILQCATENHCDLIVMSSHGRTGVRRAVMGSVTEAVSRHSPVPVLIVPALAHPTSGPAGGTTPAEATQG